MLHTQKGIQDGGSNIVILLEQKGQVFLGDVLDWIQRRSRIAAQALNERRKSKASMNLELRMSGRRTVTVAGLDGLHYAQEADVFRLPN